MAITISDIKDALMVFDSDNEVQEFTNDRFSNKYGASKYLGGYIKGMPFNLFLKDGQLIINQPGSDPFMTILPVSLDRCVTWITNIVMIDEDFGDEGQCDEDVDEDENDYLHDDTNYEDIDNDRYHGRRW